MHVCLYVFMYVDRVERKKKHKTHSYRVVVGNNEYNWYIHIDVSNSKRQKIKKAIEQAIHKENKVNNARDKEK